MLAERFHDVAIWILKNVKSDRSFGGKITLRLLYTLTCFKIDIVFFTLALKVATVEMPFIPIFRQNCQAGCVALS